MFTVLLTGKSLWRRINFHNKIDGGLMTFGGRIRAARMREKITLRKFAEMVGVSPTYISQIERNEYDPPSIERIEKIAKLLRLNADELSALAKRTPVDLEMVFQKHPNQIADFLRTARNLNVEQLQQLADKAKKLLKDGK